MGEYKRMISFHHHKIVADKTWIYIKNLEGQVKTSIHQSKYTFCCTYRHMFSEHSPEHCS